MFHYRQALTTKHIRMLLAGFLAISMHIGLLYFTVDNEAPIKPHVSLPHSVSVFLGHKSPETFHVKRELDAPKARTIDKVVTKQEIQNNEPVFEEKSWQPKESEKLSQQHEIPKKDTITVSEVLEEKSRQKTEEVLPSKQVSEHFKTVVEEEVEPAETGAVTNLPAVMEVEGVLKAGTIQLAYPNYQANVPPVYPGLARKRGQEGKVILQVLVNREGRVDDLEIDVSSGHSLLDRAAETAVRKWLFEPGKKGEEKVQMWVKVPVFFKLKK